MQGARTQSTAGPQSPRHPGHRVDQAAATHGGAERGPDLASHFRPGQAHHCGQDLAAGHGDLSPLVAAPPWRRVVMGDNLGDIAELPAGVIQVKRHPLLFSREPHNVVEPADLEQGLPAGYGRAADEAEELGPGRIGGRREW